MAKPDAKHAGPSFWEKLQPRERVLVMALLGVLIVMGTGVMLFLRYQKMTELEEEVADIREGLDLVRTFGGAYQERLADKSDQDTEIGAEPLLFSTLIEEAQSIVDIQAANQSEKPPIEIAPGLQKRTYQFDLRSVTLAQLTQFLSVIEGKEGHVVITEGMTIRSPSSSEDRLNVDVTLATYERVADEEAGETGEDGEN